NNNVLPNSGTINLNGGTLSTGATVGFSDLVGSLQLSASSTLALGTGPHSITFDGISGTPTGVLTITGWTEPPNMNGHVLFTGTSLGADPNTTFAGFLSSVQFQGYPQGQAFFTLLQSGNYELSP